MSFQKNDQSDFDFSIIDKKPPEQAKLNFSVQSLLSQHPQQSQINDGSASRNRNTCQMNNNEQYEEQGHQVNAQNGSFLQDLQKLQASLSFETQLHNVYQQQAQTLNSNSLNPLTKSYLHAKSNSHLKTTKQQSNNEPTQSLDDYGYLVLDFGIKKKKMQKLYETQKIHHKVYTQQGTSSSQKLKLSSSSGALTENCSMLTAKMKSTNKKSSLNKFLSPRVIKNHQQSSSKQKKMLKVVKSKSREHRNLYNNLAKQSEPSQQVMKPYSRQKSNLKNLNISKKTNASTTIAETSGKSNKSYTKSTRQANAYSEYYGFQDIAQSQRLVMKSNCINGSVSQKNIAGINSRNCVAGYGKSGSKSKHKKSLHSLSPANKDLAMRFKKKKTKEGVA